MRRKISKSNKILYKKWISIFVLLLVIAINGCNSGGKSDKETIYEYSEPNIELNAALKAKIGDWAEKGVECYGIILAVDSNGLPEMGLPIKAKIIRIKENKLKMKALEKVNLGPKEGCSKMGIAYGETWWETDGDFFQTKEKAEKFLRQQGLLME